MNPGTERNCTKVLEDLDLYLDRELERQGESEVESHLQNCAGCGAERDARVAIQTRLRAAVRGVKAPESLEGRVRATLQSAGPAGQQSEWRRPLMAIAAAALVISGTAIAYEMGYLRLTSGAQQAYYQTLSTQVTGLMKVALSDHIHCAFFRKYPKQPPSNAQMIEDMGPEYKALIEVVRRGVPAGYRIEQAHRCTVDERKFVHVIAKNGSKLVSLIVTRKENGESFASQVSTAVLSRTGQPVYQAKAQRFELTAMETRDYLVYVVSNLEEKENLEMLTAFAPGVEQVLENIQGRS